MKPKRHEAMTLENQKADLLRAFRLRCKEIRQMLGDKYTELPDYVLVFEKLGAVGMIASILRSDHGEHEAALEAARLHTEVNEAYAALLGEKQETKGE